ncbi:MAG: GlsB/YeaQ/YmgE family stress response membrane protein [Candidatus Limnocylindrales bacterium]
MIVTIIAWIVLGAIAGLIAGMLVKGDERWGMIGHIVLGIVGALVGGFLANALGFGSGREGGDVVNIQSIIVAIIGAVIVVLVVNMLTRRRVA